MTTNTRPDYFNAPVRNKPAGFDHNRREHMDSDGQANTEPTTETPAPEGETPTPAEAAETLDRLQEVRRFAALRYFPVITGVKFDAAECKAYGITPDGEVAEGGLTAEGIEFGDEAAKQLDEASIEHRAERHGHKRGAGHRAAASMVTDSLVASMGLRGPLRAALRQAALTFASALDEGETDDGTRASDGRRAPAGAPCDHASDPTVLPVDGYGPDGAPLSRPTLGGEPFLLLRMPDHGDGTRAITVAMGGGVLTGDPVLAKMRGGIPIEELLTVTLAGVRAAHEQGVDMERGDGPEVDLTEGRGLDHFLETLAEHGVVVDGAGVRRVGRQTIVDLRRKRRPAAEGDEAFGTGAPGAPFPGDSNLIPPVEPRLFSTEYPQHGEPPADAGTGVPGGGHGNGVSPSTSPSAPAHDGPQGGGGSDTPSSSDSSSGGGTD